MTICDSVIPTQKEGEAGDQKIKAILSYIPNKFEASLNYMKPCIKTNKSKIKNESWGWWEAQY